MDSRRLAASTAKGGAVLILAWYLLLLYRFPFSLPYRMEEDALFFYALITIATLLILVGGLLRFSVRLLRFTSYPGASGVGAEPFDSKFFPALEQHYVLHIRLLALLSVLLLSIGWLSSGRADEEEHSLSLFQSVLQFLVLWIVIAYAMIMLLTSINRDLMNPSWSPGAWTAAATLAASLLYFAMHPGNVAMLLKSFFAMLWHAFRKQPVPADSDEAEDWLDLLTVQALAGAAYLLVLASSGVSSLKRRRELLRDLRSLARWGKSTLWSRAARR